MSDRIALQNLAYAQTDASAYGTKIIKPELLEDVVAEFRAADPETGKPAGEFSQTALDALLPLLTATREEVSRSVARMLPGIIDDVRGNLWAGGTTDPTVIQLPAKNGHEVTLTTNKGFAVDATSGQAYIEELGNALFHAGEWVQASFGSNDNLFARAGLDLNGKSAVLGQMLNVINGNMDGIPVPQQQQLLGNAAGLTVEVIKSIELGGLSPTSDGPKRQLIQQAMIVLEAALDEPSLSSQIKHQLVGYLHEADSFRSKLTTEQLRKIDDKHLELNPTDPFPYDEWEAEGKDTIYVDNLSGSGEGFLYGFTKWLMEKGLGDERWREGNNLFDLVSGNADSDRGPNQLEVTVKADDPINAWGRDMKVVIDLRNFRDNMLSGLEIPKADIVGYDGHSGFGRNTLRSLDDDIEQQGHKLFYRHLCAGVDAENRIALKAPRAYANSYTTQDSGYFRKTSGGPGGMEYAYEAEGWEGVRCYIRAALGKKNHRQMQGDLKAHANWWGHSAGNSNNFVGPGDKRRGGSGDWDADGIPNMYDVMPTVNTFDVRASVANEFDLSVPDTPADRIKGGRAFQAVQFVNTATNYTTLLKSYNLNRQINPNPQGIYFDGRDDPNTYVRFEEAPDGSTYVQFNSALSDMTMESLRAVLYFETSRHLLSTNNNYSVPDHPSQVAAGLLFAMSSLEYDMSYRDRAVFDGLKKLYNIPDSVSFSDVDEAQYGAEDRHNYCGDPTALREILDKHRDALASDDVGVPSVSVT